MIKNRCNKNYHKKHYNLICNIIIYNINNDQIDFSNKKVWIEEFDRQLAKFDLKRSRDVF